MIVVTGGAGFIGSNLLRALAARGDEPVVLCDRLDTDARWKYLSDLDIEAYIEPEDLEREIARHNSVNIVHLGAISSTAEQNAGRLLRENFEFSKHVTRLANSCGGRLIYASSAATYGDGSQGFDDRDDIEYLNSLAPLNAYGWSKHLFDCWVARNAMSLVGLEQRVGLKFFNVYGPNEHHKGSMRSMVTQSLDFLDQGSPIRLFKSDQPNVADGEQARDFVSVRDCVSVICWFLDHPSQIGLFNVGTGEACTFKQLAEMAIQAVGCGEIEYFQRPEQFDGKYQDITRASIDRLRRSGYAGAFTNIKDGVEDLVQYRRNGRL